MPSPPVQSEFLLCVASHDCDDLQKGKVYALLVDDRATEEGFVRVVDDSGEDYLYPRSYFVPVELSHEAKIALGTPS